MQRKERAKTLKAKEYMEQIEKLNNMIKNKQIELQLWQDIAIGTSAPANGDRVQSSGSKEKMANAVCTYVDIEREINADIAALTEQRQEIIKTIELLSANEYDVLHMIYVQLLSTDEAAIIKHKSESWVSSIKGNALQSVQRILDERWLNENH